MNYSISFRNFEHGLIRERLNARKDIKIYMTSRLIALGLKELFRQPNNHDIFFRAINIRSYSLIFTKSYVLETPSTREEKIKKVKGLFNLLNSSNTIFLKVKND